MRANTTLRCPEFYRTAYPFLRFILWILELLSWEASEG